MKQDKSLINTVYSCILNNDFDSLDKISENNPESALALRIIFSSDQPGSIELPVPIPQLEKEAPWLMSLFKGPNYFFISPEQALQQYVFGTTKTFVGIDWSFSFDSNVADKVKAVVQGKNLGKADTDRVIQLLKYKKAFNMNTDITPFIFENMRFFKSGAQIDRIFNSIKSFKKLDYIDWSAFEENNYHLKFKCSEKTIESEVEDDLNLYANSEAVENQENRALFTKAFLTELAVLWISNPNAPKEVMINLIQFCLEQLGKFPKYELQFAHMFVSKPHKINFFGPIVGRSKDLAKKLSGMAWDLNHFRCLETMATKPGNNQFYIPFFVSFDGKFSDLITNNRIQFMVMDTKEKRLLSANEHEYEFQIALNYDYMTPKIESLLSRDHAKRRRDSDPNYESIRKALEKRTVELERLLTAGASCETV